MAITVNILYPQPGVVVPGGGGGVAWGTVTSDNPVASCSATIVDDASGGAIAGSSLTGSTGHPLPNNWMVVMENAYNGGKKVQLTVTLKDNNGNSGQGIVSFTFGAF
jgi:hypothetical protein